MGYTGGSITTHFSCIHRATVSTIHKSLSKIHLLFSLFSIPATQFSMLRSPFFSRRIIILRLFEINQRSSISYRNSFSSTRYSAHVRLNRAVATDRIAAQVELLLLRKKIRWKSFKSFDPIIP